MLILQRYRDQKIVIGRKLVTVTVVEIGGDKVRLGIEAAQEMSIHRGEVYDQIEGGEGGESQGTRAISQPGDASTESTSEPVNIEEDRQCRGT